MAKRKLGYFDRKESWKDRLDEASKTGKKKGSGDSSKKTNGKKPVKKKGK